MKKTKLIEQIKTKNTVLCVGLDTDIKRVPEFLIQNFENPVLEFNRRIIEATKDQCVSYKFNIAFYESLGPKGWQVLEDSLSLIPDHIFKIADAKRGDIGNTSNLYARTFFETYDFDAITVSPYMGSDSLEPFYGYDDKWVIILGLTSNKGSQDVQMLKTGDTYVFEEVIRRSATYGDSDNTMYVVGATKPEYLQKIRSIIPDHFILMPGIGKQGGDLKVSMKHGLNEDCGLLINSSRGIIYASGKEDFDVEARRQCEILNADIRSNLK